VDRQAIDIEIYRRDTRESRYGSRFF